MGRMGGCTGWEVGERQRGFCAVKWDRSGGEL